MITFFSDLREIRYGVMISPPPAPPVPRGGMGHNAIVPDQVIQHNRNRGCPGGGAKPPGADIPCF